MLVVVAREFVVGFCSCIGLASSDVSDIQSFSNVLQNIMGFMYSDLGIKLQRKLGKNQFSIRNLFTLMHNISNEIKFSMWVKLCGSNDAGQIMWVKWCGSNNVGQIMGANFMGQIMWVKLCGPNCVGQIMWPKLCSYWVKLFRSCYVGQTVWVNLCGSNSVGQIMWAKLSSDVSQLSRSSYVGQVGEKLSYADQIEENLRGPN